MMRRKESQPTHLGWADTSRHTSSFHLEKENESKGDDSKKASDIFAVQLKPVRCSNSVDGFIFLSFRKKIIATYAFLENHLSFEMCFMDRNRSHKTGYFQSVQRGW